MIWWMSLSDTRIIRERNERTYIHRPNKTLSSLNLLLLRVHSTPKRTRRPPEIVCFPAK
ncbi:hypothetical protein Hanom_Chr17g01549151 [Helianthus anomalus]